MPFWAVDDEVVVARVASGPTGLGAVDAARRLAEAPPPLGRRRSSDVELIVRQFRSPILLLLVVAAALSAALGDVTESAIIVAIVLASAGLGFVQERGAVHAVHALLASVEVRCLVLRDGVPTRVPIGEVVAGDVVELAAGDVVPGDALVLASNELLVDESALTGEAYPRRKRPGRIAVEAPLAERSNCVHLGTHVASGAGRALIVTTGAATEFGQVSRHLATRHVPTSFERGTTAFGLLLLRATAVLVVALFVIEVVLRRPLVDALLFALALAVGLTPQMLPAIVTLSLSRGAAAMAQRRVIVKRLDAIEDIGGLDVLCTDKTGTLTTGAVGLDGALGVDGRPSSEVGRLAWWNAHHQRGFRNPIDDAVIASVEAPTTEGVCLGEVPYDFTRKRLSVAIELGDRRLMVTKGAFEQVLACCSTIVGGARAGAEADLRAVFADLSAQGLRVLGVAVRPLDEHVLPLGTDDEVGCDFVGFITFSDPPKPGARAAIDRLRTLEVSLRLVTGDNRLAAAHIAAAMGLCTDSMLTGADLAGLDDAALVERVTTAEVFAEVSPLDKERIVRALSAAGHTVGFLGDGINDTPALHVADVGISVDTAVDVARQTADLVLLDKDLDVLGDGLAAGRSVFANTLKYVHVTTSANFGNMLSMAAAAAFLPFLPMLPMQILLLNFLSDIPATTVSTDRVDPEQLGRPCRWDVHRVRDFMIVFGLVSTVFDLLTFAVLRWGLDAGPELFRTGWFIESTATELAALLVLRTPRTFLHSRPSTALAAASLGVLAVVVALPFTPLAAALGFVTPSVGLLGALAAITAGYVMVTEWWKHRLPSLFASGAAVAPAPR